MTTRYDIIRSLDVHALAVWLREELGPPEQLEQDFCTRLCKDRARCGDDDALCGCPGIKWQKDIEAYEYWLSR